MLYIAALLIGGLLTCWYYERQLDKQALASAESTLRDLGVVTDRIGLGEPKTPSDDDVPLPFEMPFNIRDYVPPKHHLAVSSFASGEAGRRRMHLVESQRRFTDAEVEAWN